MTLKDWLLGGGVVLSLALAVGLSGHTTIVDNLGNASSPAVVDGCMNVNGVETCSYSVGMKAASTTCSILAPINSTLLYAGAQVNRSSTGATLQYEWGRANTAFATTTSLGLGSLTTAAAGTVVASSTITTDNLQTVFPSTAKYLNLKVGSSSPNDQSGICRAVFIKNSL